MLPSSQAAGLRWLPLKAPDGAVLPGPFHVLNLSQPTERHAVYLWGCTCGSVRVVQSLQI